jgi:hypothetical protein
LQGTHRFPFFPVPLYYLSLEEITAAALAITHMVEEAVAASDEVSDALSLPT